MSMTIAKAQCFVSGNVIDNVDSIPIVGATVRIMSADSMFVGGGTTNNNGDFNIKISHRGTYVITLSSLGYENKSFSLNTESSVPKMVVIKMLRKEYSLDDVVVTGNSYVRKDGYLQITPDKTISKHSYSGYDLMYNLMVPGLKVDRRNGKVTARGAEVSMYINGIKSTQRDVENLLAKDIIKVEYHDVPKGKYAGEPAVINYITKVYETGGYVAMTAEQNIGYNGGKYDVAGKVKSHATSLTLYGGHEYQRYDGISEDVDEYLAISDKGIGRTSNNKDGEYSRNQQYFQMKLSHDTKKSTLYGMATLLKSNTPHDDKTNFLVYDKGMDESILSKNFSSSDNVKPSLKLYGAFHLANNQELDITLDGSYARNKYERQYTENDYLSTTKANEDLYSLFASFFYNIEMRHQNSMSFSVMHKHDVTSALYSGDYDSWQHLWKGETMIFAQYMQKIKKTTFLVNPGLSILSYRLHGNDAKCILSPRLNSWILYDITNKQRAGAGFSVGNNNPDISYLNSTDQTIDKYQIKRGNPNLDNTNIYEIFAQYTGMFGRLNTEMNIWYTTLTNNVTPDYYLDNGTLINSFRSNSTFHTFKLDISASYKFSDHLRANTNLKYERMSLAENSTMKEDNFFGSFDINYFIGIFTVNAFVKSTERKLDSSTLIFSKTPASYGASVRMNKGNWQVEMGTNNPFSSHLNYREISNFDLYYCNKSRASRIYQQTGYIKLAYSFDFGKKTNREYKNVNTEINSAILKVQ